MPSRSRRPSLRRELLFWLSGLFAAAVSIAIIAALIAQFVDPSLGVVVLASLILADAAVVALAARFLIGRLVDRPLRALTSSAQEIASGNLARRAPEAATAEFNELADRFNEMTERLLDAQSQLVRAEKLAGIGRLAAGVAHEIGNPLSAVGTYLDVLRKRGADPEVVSALRREADRIDQIVRGLLEYARPREERLDTIDLSSVVRAAISLLEQQGALRGVRVAFEGETDAPSVRGRFHELEQVAVNLLLNAADAAPGGTIVAGVTRWTVERDSGGRARRSDPSPYPRASRPSVRRPFRPDIPAGTVGALLYVTDSGTGVPEADRERVFDPFFTTKPPGSGTGLGLAIVQRTVHELGGMIWVEDAREGGAAFKVFLPAARGFDGSTVRGIAESADRRTAEPPTLRESGP